MGIVSFSLRKLNACSIEDKDVLHPTEPTCIAEAAEARDKHVFKSYSLVIEARKAPIKVSPAPVVSKTVSAKAGI